MDDLLADLRVVGIQLGQFLVELLLALLLALLQLSIKLILLLNLSLLLEQLHVLSRGLDVGVVGSEFGQFFRQVLFLLLLTLFELGLQFLLSLLEL